MSILEKVRSYLSDYTGFGGEIECAEVLSKKTGAYSVDSVPCTETVKRYYDGSAVKQYIFTISGREFLDGEPGRAEDNMDFYESLTAWLEAKNRAGQLPDLGTGKKSLSLTASGRAYPVTAEGDGTARYQLRCLLKYYESKGESL